MKMHIRQLITGIEELISDSILNTHLVSGPPDYYPGGTQTRPLRVKFGFPERRLTGKCILRVDLKPRTSEQTNAGAYGDHKVIRWPYKVGPNPVKISLDHCELDLTLGQSFTELLNDVMQVGQRIESGLKMADGVYDKYLVRPEPEEPTVFDKIAHSPESSDVCVEKKNKDEIVHLCTDAGLDVSKRDRKNRLVTELSEYIDENGKPEVVEKHQEWSKNKTKPLSEEDYEKEFGTWW